MIKPILYEKEFTPAQTAQKHYSQTDPKVIRVSAEGCQTFAPGMVDTVFADSLPDVLEPPPLTGKACCGRCGEPFHAFNVINRQQYCLEYGQEVKGVF